MKWCRFQIGAQFSHGIVEDDTVIEVAGTDGDDGDVVPGDVIEVEISGIGTLRNPIVAET